MIEAALFIAYRAEKNAGNDPSLRGYLASSLLLFIVPTVAVIWLGVLISAIAIKARRTSKRGSTA